MFVLLYISSDVCFIKLKVSDRKRKSSRRRSWWTLIKCQSWGASCGPHLNEASPSCTGCTTKKVLLRNLGHPKQKGILRRPPAAAPCRNAGSRGPSAAKKQGAEVPPRRSAWLLVPIASSSSSSLVLLAVLVASLLWWLLSISSLVFVVSCP